MVNLHLLVHVLSVYILCLSIAFSPSEYSSRSASYVQARYMIMPKNLRRAIETEPNRVSMTKKKRALCSPGRARISYLSFFIRARSLVGGPRAYYMHAAVNLQDTLAVSAQLLIRRWSVCLSFFLSLLGELLFSMAFLGIPFDRDEE